LALACGGAVETNPEASPDASQRPAPDRRAPQSLPPSTPPSACVTPEHPACEDALDVATSEEVLAEIARLAEVSGSLVAPPSGTRLRPSRDLHATADIEIAAGDVQLQSPVCREDEAGCEGPWFTNETSYAGVDARWPDGITCVERSGRGEGRCVKIRVARGYRVRFHRLVMVSHWAQQSIHAIRVVRPCTHQCGRGEVLCASSMTCIEENSMCLFCEGLPQEVCACRMGCGRRADGDECTYDESEDVLFAGKCSNGTCQ
jgi:hypothetical protein